MIVNDSTFPVQSKMDVDSKESAGEPYDVEDHDLSTAKHWTLHLRVENDITSVQALADQILGTGAEVLTGNYVGGDSFAEWCEVFDREEWYQEHGRALHIYLVARCRTHAVDVAQALLRTVGEERYFDAKNATLSTSGDWAEQTEVWPQAQVFV